MKYHIFIISILLVFYTEKTFSQEDQTASSKKILLGGNFGFQFGNTTIINISPNVGYKFNDKLIAGTGLIYQYYNFKDYNYSTNVYGFNIFGRYYLYNDLFGHAEYELINMDSPTYLKKKRINIDSFFIGGGITRKISDNTSVNFYILWNLLEKIYTPYQNPIIRISFDIGI